MGKLGRFACIFTPMALTLGSLICLALVLSGQLNRNNSIQRDLYFFKADTRDFNADPKGVEDHLPDNVNLDNNLLQALQGAAQTNELEDFYLVGLWNFCEGEIKDGKENIKHCSARKNEYWFNPVEEWKLENTSAQKVFPDEMQKGLDTYRKVSKWMFAAYMITLVLTVAEVLVGISAIFSRWGSLITTVVSTAQTIFYFAAATTSTALYASLVAVFESVLKPYDIKASMGKKMLATLWLGVAFALASGFFWLISVCCCSGKSGHKKVVVEKTPYTYERVASPYLGASGNNHQMQDMGHRAGASGHGTSGSAYEPFRQQHV